MVRGIEIGWIANSAAKFDGFERVGIIKGEEFDNKLGSLRHEPQVKGEVAGVQSATCIHKAAECRVGGRIGSDIDSDMREPIINGNGHRGKRRARGRGICGKGLDNDHHITGTFERCWGVSRGFGCRGQWGWRGCWWQRIRGREGLSRRRCAVRC
jgi:hypothetical protein